MSLIECPVNNTQKVSLGRVTADNHQHRLTWDASNLMNFSTVGAIAIIDDTNNYTIGNVTINSDKTISINWTKTGNGGTGTIGIRITALYF